MKKKQKDYAVILLLLLLVIVSISFLAGPEEAVTTKQDGIEQACKGGCANTSYCQSNPAWNFESCLNDCMETGLKYRNIQSDSCSWDCRQTSTLQPFILASTFQLCPEGSFGPGSATSGAWTKKQ